MKTLNRNIFKMIKCGGEDSSDTDVQQSDCPSLLLPSLVGPSNDCATDVDGNDRKMFFLLHFTGSS